MQTVTMYHILAGGFVTVPKQAEFLKVIGWAEDDEPLLYVIVDADDTAYTTWHFYVAITGTALEILTGYKYLTTVCCGPWIKHVWAGPEVKFR